MREARGWIFAAVGFLLFILLQVETVSNVIPGVASSGVLWLAWIIVAIGALDAMQIINVLGPIENKLRSFLRKDHGSMGSDSIDPPAERK